MTVVEESLALVLRPAGLRIASVRGWSLSEPDP
jgi:hypothetical protein